MAKPQNKLSLSLRRKQDRLDWQQFNFLENLLIFCPMKERSVPKESGVHFRITFSEPDSSVCLLFKIDRKEDPLVRENVARPDYLTFFASDNLCLCTLIEMKGKNDLERGIEQVVSLKDILRREFQQHLPNRLVAKMRLQGILLCPFNSQIPNRRILKEAARGLTILPLLCNQKAELSGYVSKINSASEKYKHEGVRNGRGLSSLELILVSQSLPKRIQDSFYAEHFLHEPPQDREGLYVNYLLSDDEEYAALSLTKSRSTIGISEKRKEFQEPLSQMLARFGVTSIQPIK